MGPARVTAARRDPTPAGMQAAQRPCWRSSKYSARSWPEAEIQPSQAAKQWRLRHHTVQRASTHQRRRSMAFIRNFMNRVQAAAAALSGGAAARLAKARAQAAHDDPLDDDGAFAVIMDEYGEGVKDAMATTIRTMGVDGETRSPRQHQRKAALQRLDPHLDVRKVLKGAPLLLSSHKAEVLAAKWADGCDNDGMRALVECLPTILSRSIRPIAWKLPLLRDYELERQAAGGPSSGGPGPAGLRIPSMARMLHASPKVSRLPYLATVLAFEHSAQDWVMMTDEQFEPLHGPGFQAWLEEHPIPPQAFRGQTKSKTGPSARERPRSPDGHQK